MLEPALTDLSVSPGFDLEEFMNFSREARLSSEALESLIERWQDWAPRLRAVQIKAGKASWLALWLPEDVEAAIDAAWEESPSEGFLINSLAQYMCMSAVAGLVPEADAGGCAPAPEPALALEAGLERLGLGHAGALARRYAVLTYYPFHGGCEICALSDACPKRNGAPEFASITLPGHERGKS